MAPNERNGFSVGRVHVVEESSLSPGEVLEAARDFSERRADLWTDVHLKHFEIHEIGDTYAEVTEGNPEPFGFIWERLRYDWSQPGALKGTVIDSNIFKPGSTWELRASPNDGGSRVEIIGHRDARGPKGWIIWAYIKTGLAKRYVATQLRHFLAEAERGQAG